MYHKQVSSSPRLVRLTISVMDPAASGAVRTRLSIAGVTGSPDSRAVCRVWTRAPSLPAEIQSVRPVGRPLSNTDDSRDEACATTKGAHCRPASAGSLYSDNGRLASCSPTRVPPPALLKTVRPSRASLAPADQYM